MTVISSQTKETLARRITIINGELEKLEIRREILESEREDIKMELERCDLELFWSTHANLRLNPKDELRGTLEFRNWHKRHFDTVPFPYAGERFTIVYVKPPSEPTDYVVFICEEDRPGKPVRNIPLDVAWQLRQAYLESSVI